MRKRRRTCFSCSRRRRGTGGFSFRIFQLGTYRATATLTLGGESVTGMQTVAVSEAPGDSRCSATGAPPP